jgi:hypothetical protein
MGSARRRQCTVRPVLARSIRPARASTSRCLITAGSDTSNRSAIWVTPNSLSFASRSRIARRVGSASAAKARSSWAALKSTIWLSIIPCHARQDGKLHNRVHEVDGARTYWAEIIFRGPWPGQCLNQSRPATSHLACAKEPEAGQDSEVPKDQRGGHSTHFCSSMPGPVRVFCLTSESDRQLF